MLPKRGEPATPYEPRSNTRKPKPSGPRRGASPKKSIAVKGAKPRGIFEVWARGDELSKEIQEGIEGLSTIKFDGFLTPLSVYAQLREDSATI